MEGWNKNLKDKRRISAQSFEWNPLVHSGDVPYLFQTMVKKKLYRQLDNINIKIEDFYSIQGGLKEDNLLVHQSISDRTNRIDEPSVSLWEHPSKTLNKKEIKTEMAPDGMRCRLHNCDLCPRTNTRCYSKGKEKKWSST